MSVIEDSRKVLQDFIAPELRAIDVRLTSLEKQMDGLERQVDKRFDQVDGCFNRLESPLERRFNQVLEEIRSLKNLHELELRMAKYEAMLPSAESRARQAKPASEAA